LPRGAIPQPERDLLCALFRCLVVPRNSCFCCLLILEITLGFGASTLGNPRILIGFRALVSFLQARGRDGEPDQRLCKPPMRRGDACRQRSHAGFWTTISSFRRCAQLDISRLGSMPRFICARSATVSQQHVRHRVSAIRASALSCFQDDTTKFFDFVVIGSGVAGLRYALEVSKHGSVAIITKAEPHESNTNYAQGGVSAVLCPSDSVESHMKDTIVAGAYLCDEETVRIVCTEGPERVKELIAMGASFDHGEDGRLHLAREGGHSHNRIVHSADMTGREIERALLQAVDNDDNISLFGHHFAIDLLTCQKNGEIHCYGVDSIDIETQKVVRFISKVTLLASGGVGHIYPTTTNPPVATGDGIAMSHRAQAVISNME